jgi:transposase
MQDHLPLYRQSQIYARQGVDIDRLTLAFWTGKAAYELRPVHDALLAHLKTSSKLVMPSRQITTQSSAG